MRFSHILTWVVCWAALVLIGDALAGLAGFSVAWGAFLLATFAVLYRQERRGRGRR